ncbi:MAG: SPFH domain-containing protein [bacterium]
MPDVGGIHPIIPIVVAGVVVIGIIFIFVFANRYVKVGPNEVLIVSGRQNKFRKADGSVGVRGFRVVRGGGTFVWPVFEKVNVLSLELLTLDVQTPEVYTIQGVPILVDGVAQIKVKGDDLSIATAAEQMLSKGPQEIKNIALMTLEGHLRAILGTLTVEEIYKNREAFAQRVQEVATVDMANMGLQVVSFTIRDIRDNQGYLAALGKPRTAEVKRDAIIGQAEADRDATIKSAQANQMGQQARFAAETKIAESDRDYRVKLAEYEMTVNKQKAQADLAYELQKFKTNQEVKKEEVQVMVIEKETMISVQENEIKRKEKELDATIRKPAEADRFKIQTLADAQRYRSETEAKGEAEAIKATGFAGADVEKARGFAEAEANKARGLAAAEVIRAQGLSEAEAMRKKAESWSAYNQAAVAQMVIDALPQIARAISEPLSRTEKMIIINTGSDGGGASKVTGDITKILAQIPPVVEALTGLDLADLLKEIPALKKSAEARKGKGGEAEAEVIPPAKK